MILDRIPPLGTAAAMASICLFTTWIGRPPQTAASGKPIEGTLFSLAADTAAAAGQAAQPAARPAARESYPEVPLSLDSAARARFPGGTDFLIHIVEPEAAYVALVLARHQPKRSILGKAVKNSAFPAKKPLASRAGLPIETPQTSSATATSTAAAAAPESTPRALQAPPPPKPTLPVTYTEFDQALRASPTAEAINPRIKRGGVTFRATHVGAVVDRGVVRFALANEEAADFFLSIINVTVGGAPIHSEVAGPYVCAAGQEVFGIAHFALADVTGKSVTIELVQSGGDRRRFSLDIPYKF